MPNLTDVSIVEEYIKSLFPDLPIEACVDEVGGYWGIHLLIYENPKDTKWHVSLYNNSGEDQAIDGSRVCITYRENLGDHLLYLDLSKPSFEEDFRKIIDLSLKHAKRYKPRYKS